MKKQHILMVFGFYRWDYPIPINREIPERHCGLCPKREIASKRFQ